MQLDSGFIRQEKINIKRYLPEYLSKDDNFKATLDSESLEHERLRAVIYAYLQEQFVRTASITLDRYEEFVDEYHSDETDESRQGKIIAKYQGLATSTVDYLTNQAELFSGQDVIVSEDNANYILNISVDSKAQNIDKLTAFIEKYKPAHLGLTYDFITRLRSGIYVGGAAVDHVYIENKKTRSWEFAPPVNFAGGILEIKVEVRHG